MPAGREQIRGRELSAGTPVAAELSHSIATLSGIHANEREIVMPKTLMATCPHCRTEVNTGIAADEQTMRELGPKLAVLVLCDGCREYQRMMVNDLYLGKEAPDVAA